MSTPEEPPTLRPGDFPVEQLAAREQAMYVAALREQAEARSAVQRGEPYLAVARYEACIARLQELGELQNLSRRVASHLSARHAAALGEPGPGEPEEDPFDGC